MLERIRKNQEQQADLDAAGKDRKDRESRAFSERMKQAKINGKENFEQLLDFIRHQGIWVDASSDTIECDHFKVQRINESADREGYPTRSSIFPGFDHEIIYCNYPGNEKCFFIVSDRKRISKIATDHTSKANDLRDKFVLFIENRANFFEYPLYYRAERVWVRGEQTIGSYVADFFSGIMVLEKGIK